MGQPPSVGVRRCAPGVHVRVADPRHRDPQRLRSSRTCAAARMSPGSGARTRCSSAVVSTCASDHAASARVIGSVGNSSSGRSGGVVIAQAEVAGHDLGSVVRGRTQSDRRGRPLYVGGHVGEAELVDDEAIKGGDGDQAGGRVDGGERHRRAVGARDVTAGQRGERGQSTVGLGARQALGAAEVVAVQVAHQPGVDDLALLGGVPVGEGHLSASGGREDRAERGTAGQDRGQGKLEHAGGHHCTGHRRIARIPEHRGGLA